MHQTDWPIADAARACVLHLGDGPFGTELIVDRGLTVLPQRIGIPPSSFSVAPFGATEHQSNATNSGLCGAHPDTSKPAAATFAIRATKFFMSPSQIF
jgi:hypothetical protein